MDQHFGGWWNGVFAQTLHRALSQRRPLSKASFIQCTLRADHAGLRGSGGVGLVLAWWGRRGRRRRGPSLRDTTLPTGRVVDRPETERPIIDKKLLKRKRLFFFFGLFAMSLRRSALLPNFVSGRRQACGAPPPCSLHLGVWGKVGTHRGRRQSSRERTRASSGTLSRPRSLAGEATGGLLGHRCPSARRSRRTRVRSLPLRSTRAP
jgi:hypothetical protein